jgi:hypothetical protein
LNTSFIILNAIMLAFTVGAYIYDDKAMKLVPLIFVLSILLVLGIAFYASKPSKGKIKE